MIMMDINDQEFNLMTRTPVEATMPPRTWLDPPYPYNLGKQSSLLGDVVLEVK